MKICNITSSLFPILWDLILAIHYIFLFPILWDFILAIHLIFHFPIFCFKTLKEVKTKSLSSHFPPHLPLLFSSLTVSPIFLPLNTTFLFILSHFLNPKHHFISFSQTPNTHISVFSLIFLTPKHLSHFFPLSLTFSLIPTFVSPFLNLNISNI